VVLQRYFGDGPDMAVTFLMVCNLFPLEFPLMWDHGRRFWRWIYEDHVWFEDRWMVTSECDE
jgi:hypothetical protein